MKRILVLLTAFSAFILYSCGHPEDTDKKSKKDEPYYPIADYIRDQVKYVDSNLFAIMHYTTIDGKKDSSIMEKADFDKMAQDFMQPNLNDPAVKPKYEETSFADATIGTYTFTYSTKDEKAPLWKADVYLRQADTKVIYVYLEKQYFSADSTVTKKITWKTNKNVVVVSIIKKPNQPDKIIEEKFEWDNSEQ